MPALIFEGYATDRRGRENRKLSYFKAGSRRVVLNEIGLVMVGSTGKGYFVSVSANSKWWVNKLKKFDTERLYFNSSDFSCAEGDMLRMLYPQYKEIVEDIIFLLSLIKSSPVIDNDFEALLSLCNQAQEKHYESQRSIQTS